MIDSRFENIGNNIKIVGYLSPLSNSDDAESNKDDDQILAIGLPAIIKNELKYFPDSETQMKEWKIEQILSAN